MLDWIYKELAAILKHIKWFRNLQKIVFSVKIVKQNERWTKTSIQMNYSLISSYYILYVFLSSVNDVWSGLCFIVSFCCFLILKYVFRKYAQSYDIEIEIFICVSIIEKNELEIKLFEEKLVPLHWSIDLFVFRFSICVCEQFNEKCLNN